MKKRFKGIQVSSGNSFVHETESQVILGDSSVIFQNDSAFLDDYSAL